MSNQPSSPTTQAAQNQVNAPTESVVSKIIGGFMWWIGSLTGKPQAPKKQTAAKPAPTAAPAPDDPVSQDLQALKKFVGKIKQDVSKNVAPVVSKGVASTEVTAASMVNKVDKGALKKVLKIVVILLVVLIIIFAGVMMFKNLKLPAGLSGGNSPTPSSAATPTPTPIVFVPPQKSIYADDPAILKLEQELNVLTREVSGTNIRENTLNPPTLDFNISF